MAKATIKVVGVRAGDRLDRVETLLVGDDVLLMPETDNPADPNAVAVLRIPDGTGPTVHVGYLPAGWAARYDVNPFGTTATVERLRVHDGVTVGFDVSFDTNDIARRPDTAAA